MDYYSGVGVLHRLGLGSLILKETVFICMLLYRGAGG